VGHGGAGASGTRSPAHCEINDLLSLAIVVASAIFLRSDETIERRSTNAEHRANFEERQIARLG